MNRRKYTSVTANLNKDGSPSIIAWYQDGKTRRFDTIPLYAVGGEVRIVTAYETEEERRAE